MTTQLNIPNTTQLNIPNTTQLNIPNDNFTKNYRASIEYREF